MSVSTVGRFDKISFLNPCFRLQKVRKPPLHMTYEHVPTLPCLSGTLGRSRLAGIADHPRQVWAR